MGRQNVRIGKVYNPANMKLDEKTQSKLDAVIYSVDWKCAKQHVHDASGIAKPENYLWYKKDGIYYPLV